MGTKFLKISAKDLIEAFQQYQLVSLVSWSDVRNRYRRSVLGPFWLTISLGVMIGTISFIFGSLLKIPNEIFVPYVACGLVFWGFIISTINESCTAFISGERIIKQLPIPLSFHILRVIWKNVLILAHNMIVIPVVFFIVGKEISWSVFMVIPGLFIVAINLLWISMLLGMLCARYRDLTPIIGSIMTVFFYITPIMWMPEMMSERKGLVLIDINIFNHFIELLRQPLLGNTASLLNWTAAIISSLFGSLLTYGVFGYLKCRIAYWL